MQQTFLTPGKVTTVLDAQAGSSSKGLISAWLVKNELPDILITANGRNSSHTVQDTSDHGLLGRERLVFKVLPAGAFYNGARIAVGKTYRPLIYIGPGAAFKVKDLIDEMTMVGLQPYQLVVHPLASIVTDEDSGFENGTHDFHGKPLDTVDHSSGTTSTGTTGSGAGAARAKKSLRKGTIAAHSEWLKEAGVVRDETMIIKAIRAGCTALLDGSQGYWLGLYAHFYPNTTSRSTTLASFFAECNLPLDIVGDVCAVARTFPIRINSKRYFLPSESRFLTWDEVQAERAKVPTEQAIIEEVDSFSGGWWDDQEEYTWERLSKEAGHDIQPELTTLTKLPRRIASWSHKGFRSFLDKNSPPNRRVHLFVTFLNYLPAARAAEFLFNVMNQQADSGGGCMMGNLHVSNSPETDSVSPCGDWETFLSRPRQQNIVAGCDHGGLPPRRFAQINKIIKIDPAQRGFKATVHLNDGTSRKFTTDMLEKFKPEVGDQLIEWTNATSAVIDQLAVQKNECDVSSVSW